MSRKPPSPVAIDFETFGIESRPHYPPVPVSVSIGYPGKPVVFLAWGHVNGGNNCTWGEARAALAKAWGHPGGVLCHNAKFDTDVAETHFGLAPLPWDKIHDTMFLIFLDNPHALNLGLKESAQRLLDWPPEEKDAVADWLTTHQPVPGVKIGSGANSKEPAGKYIAFAPGDVVGPYANGDVRRTIKIFEKLWKSVCVDRRMLAAYDRERELMPVLLESERNGVRVDLARLERDIALYDGWMGRLDAWLRKELGDPRIPTKARKGCPALFEPLNIDATQQLADAMVKAGKADAALMGVTPKGSIATNKEAVRAGVTDKVFGAVLTYRSQLQTCLSTFMKPWAIMARASGGLIYTNWNQTRGERGGARTGRLSSTPNFQNIPKEFAALFFHENVALPRCPWKDLPGLPLCRDYIIPYHADHSLLDRDYSQQEPRILAHFEDGNLKDQYLENPWIDFHDNAKEHLERVMHRHYERRPVKNINLGLIYGQGVGSLAIKNDSTVEETRELKDAILKMYPGLKELYQDMRRRAAQNVPIRTWGGREYYCEEAKYVEKFKKVITFDYKMVNTLVQGSASDCTKEAVIRMARWVKEHGKGNSWFILLQVHDSILLSVPVWDFEKANKALRACMESVEFDVQILSEGDYSLTTWHAVEKHDRKGKIVDSFDIKKVLNHARRRAA